VGQALERHPHSPRASFNAYVSCQYGTSGDPGARLSALIQRLDKKPMPVGNRTLTRGLAMTGMLESLSHSWWDLDAALSAADQGDGQLLLRLADVFDGRRPDGSYTNVRDAASAIMCLDHFLPSDIASYDQVGPALATASPFFGPWLQSAYLGCSYWPVKPKGMPGPLSADGAPPILLVGATGDSRTPYAWALGVNKQLAGSVLLTRKGYGHVSYDKSDCVKQAVDAYLIDLTLPAQGTVCDSQLPWAPFS